MKYCLTVVTITLSLNLHAQIKGITLPEKLENDRMKWDKWQQDFNMAGVYGEGYYKVANYYTVVHRIEKKDYNEFKTAVKDFAKSYLGEACRIGNPKIMIVVKTGGLFGTHVFRFNVQDLIFENNEK